jgi:hypothetical protein
MNNLDSIDEALAGGGAKSAFTKDTPVGTRISGVIVDASVQQIKDYVTEKLKFWDDGRPQEQIAIRIKTDLRDPAREDDDGIRGVYVKTWGAWKEALLEAVRNSGQGKVSEALRPGGVFTAEFYGTQPSKQGSDTKLYRYQIQPAQSAALDSMGANPSTGEVAATHQPVTPPIAYAPPVQAAPPVPQAAPAAPAPVQQVPAPAAAPAPAAGPDPIATARQLIGLGIDDQTIAANTGLDPVVLAALRNQAA